MEEIVKQLPAEVLPLVREVVASLDPAHMLAYEMRDDAPRIHVSPNSKVNAAYVNNEWSMGEGDVLVCSYPKTGTNWTMEVVGRMIYQDPKQFDTVKQLPMPLRALEMCDVRKFKILDALNVGRRLLGSHLSPHQLDVKKLTDKKVKIVYVLRNPKDTLVSFYHFMKKMPPFQNEPLKGMMTDWPTFYKHYMNGAFPMDYERGGNYLDHVLLWHELRDECGIHFLYYEDLKKDFDGEARKLAAYIGAHLSEEKLKEIGEKCTVASMRKNYEEREGFQGQFAGHFIRKGGVGGWKDMFTVAQSEEWDKMVDDKLASTDVRFQYTI